MTIVVHICGPEPAESLEKYGAKVWVEFHPYCGPSFYRSKRCITEIRNPSKKTWDAFSKWLEARDKKGK